MVGVTRCEHSICCHQLPSRLVAWGGLQVVIVIGAIANNEICFFRRETFPPFGLVQKRPLLKRTQGRSLPTQRSYGAISSHIFYNNLPIHDHDLFSPLASQWSPLPDKDFRLVTAVESELEWFPKS